MKISHIIPEQRLSLSVRLVADVAEFAAKRGISFDAAFSTCMFLGHTFVRREIEGRRPC